MLLPRATYNRCCSRTATTVSKNPVTKEKGITLKHFLIFPSLPMNPPRPGHCSSCLYLSFFLCPSICHVTRLSLFFTALLNHSCVIFSAFFSICSFLFMSPIVYLSFLSVFTCYAYARSVHIGCLTQIYPSAPS